MSPETRNLWYWVTECVDDYPASWCPPGTNRGPTYYQKVTDAIWQELKQLHHRQTVYVDQEYTYQLLDGQFKQDGRGAQANVQLWTRTDPRQLRMNLHIPLYRNEAHVIPADPADKNQAAWQMPPKKMNYSKKHK